MIGHTMVARDIPHGTIKTVVRTNILFNEEVDFMPCRIRLHLGKILECAATVSPVKNNSPASAGEYESA